MFAVKTGYGDGEYHVDGLYDGDELRAVEVEFIGPQRDEILEAFPILRY